MGPLVNLFFVIINREINTIVSRAREVCFPIIYVLLVVAHFGIFAVLVLPGHVNQTMHLTMVMISTVGQLEVLTQ